MDRDIDKRKTTFTKIRSIPRRTQKHGEIRLTNNKVLLSHFEPPTFTIALAIHEYDNAVAFGPRDFAANEISTP